MTARAIDSRIDQLVQRAEGDAAVRVVREVAAFIRASAGDTRLVKALTGGQADPEAKKSLVSDIVKNSFHDVSVDLIVGVALRSKLSTFASSLLDVTADFAFVAARESDELQANEQALYALGSAVRSDSSLREAISDPSVDAAAKGDLIATLLAGKSDESTIELAKAAVALDGGRNAAKVIDELSERAASVRSHVVAEVRTAVELDAERRQKLAQALSESVGHPVQPRFVVDPTIVGSVVVRVGDEVLDGSIRNRLEQARAAIVGATS